MFSFQSAWTLGSNSLTKFPLVAVFEEYIKDLHIRYNFNSEICRYINFELSVLEAGVKSEAGYYGESLPDAGEPLCGPFRFVYAGTKSDGKARRFENAFHRNSASTFICIDCAATQPYTDGPMELCYTDCASTAGRGK